MGKDTSIGWTDHTFNAWWGCVRVSPGCEHCYAETFAKRTGHAVWGPAKTTPRRFFGDKHWTEPVKWNADAAFEGVRRRVFCASMADVFEDHPDLPPWREKLFGLIQTTPYLDWQLLTKRPENVMGMVPESWRAGFPPNVWIGASAEDQRRLDERFLHLVDIPAVVRFLSCEPLVGPMSFRWLGAWRDYAGKPIGLRSLAGGATGNEITNHLDGLRRIQWVIIGGESGPGARPMDLDVAGQLAEQCIEAGVAVFVKQLGKAHAPGPFDAKAEDIAHFPANLRHRAFPSDSLPANAARPGTDEREGA